MFNRYTTRMTTVFVNAADMQHLLGDIPLERIRMSPPPGSATVEDAVRIQETEGRTCELVDGVLVEKAVGYFESRLAATLIYFLERYLETTDLGIVLAPDGMLQLADEGMRAADVSIIRWEKFPDRVLPAEPVPVLVPDLAVEILSIGNTQKEMNRKLDEYFAAGVQDVWVIDPTDETAELFEQREDSRSIDSQGLLTAPKALPGFSLSLDDLFAKAGRRG